MANGIINKNYDDDIAQLKTDVTNLINNFSNKILSIYGSNTSSRTINVSTLTHHIFVMWTGKDGVYDVLLASNTASIISGSGADKVTINSFSNNVYNITISGFEWYTNALILTSGAFV